MQYGVDSITKQVEADLTFGDLQDSDSFKGALGFGDNTKALEFADLCQEVLAKK